MGRPAHPCREVAAASSQGTCLPVVPCSPSALAGSSRTHGAAQLVVGEGVVGEEDMQLWFGSWPAHLLLLRPLPPRPGDFDVWFEVNF